jgi:hypothetical protein
VKIGTDTDIKMDVKSTMNMNMAMITNVHINIKLDINAKMEMNMMLQMGMRRCRFAGRAGQRSKPRGGKGPPLNEGPEDLPPDRAEMSRRQPRGELQMLLCFGSKAIIKYVAMRRPIFGNEYC